MRNILQFVQMVLFCNSLERTYYSDHFWPSFAGQVEPRRTARHLSILDKFTLTLSNCLEITEGNKHSIFLLATNPFDTQNLFMAV